MNPEMISSLARCYRRTATRYNFTTQEQREGFLASGHKCWGRTEDRETFVICRSPTTGDLAVFTGDSLEEVLLVVAMLGCESGVPLEEILDPEYSRN